MTTPADADPHVTEALANAVTHGLGLAASLIAVRRDPTRVAKPGSLRRHPDQDDTPDE